MVLQVVIRMMFQIQDEVAVGSLERNKLSVIHTNTIFGIQLIGQIHELLLIPDVFEWHNIMGI